MNGLIVTNKNTAKLAEEEMKNTFKKTYTVCQKALVKLLKDAEGEEREELLDLMREVKRSKSEFLSKWF